MGVNSLPRTVIRQRSGCDLNPGPSASESCTLTTRLPRHPASYLVMENLVKFRQREKFIDIFTENFIANFMACL